ncbi:MAG: hypothetical protein R3F39_06085 [Myxococcota bacterium]
MISALLALSLAATAAAPSERHAYQPGFIERFELSMRADLRHGGPDAPLQSYDVSANLTLRVTGTRGGERTGTLSVDDFSVTHSGVAPIARAPELPPGLLSVPVTVRRDGRIVAGEALLLVTDRRRGPWVARVATDAQGLLPAPSGRGLRASHVLGFESRSGRPILPPPAAAPEDRALGADQTTVPLLPLDGLALVPVPAKPWRVDATQHERVGPIKLTSTVTMQVERRTALTVRLAAPAPSAVPAAPPVRLGRDGSIVPPRRELSAAGRRPGLSLSGELNATFDGGRRTLSGLDATLERVETLELSPPRHVRLAIRLRRQR